MSEPLNKVGAAVPFLVLRGVGCEGARLKEEEVPAGERQADVEGEAQFVRRRGGDDRIEGQSGNDTLVGLGARVLPGVSVGQACVIGAGAVVTRDVADGGIVVGCPARSLG